MAEALSALFDGELHWLEPDEHFSAEGARLVLAGFEPIENDDLSPFETEAEASYDDKPALYKHDNKPVEADLEQAWGSLSIELSAFASICGFDKKQYQHKHNVKGVPSEWSFQTTGFVAERM